MDSFSENGYMITDFNQSGYLLEIQEIITDTFSCNPLLIHKTDIDSHQRLLFMKKAKDIILKKQLIKKFLLDNLDSFTQMMGSDIDVQSDIHLRVSRPNIESDFIDWHRDTFYGNSLWEINVWIPIFPLETGAGLMLIPGSHLRSGNNVRTIQDENSFRKTVTKGSLANELGYTYASKTDDLITAEAPTCDTLLTPKFGQGIIFSGHTAHRACNNSSSTRISIDFRLKHMLAETNTKSGYYQPLIRSFITNCIERMIEVNHVSDGLIKEGV
ncbi:MAG: phytanoyl-CoA dioxygenase family protein [Legionella sp.]|nr:phytanoyl-CoA dioxygenase family protein [Legionella sp.]